MIAHIAEEKARLKARLAELEAAEKAAREKLEAIAGRVVLKTADNDPDFAARIRDLLDRNLTKKRERAMFELPEKSAAAGLSSAAGGSNIEDGSAAGNPGTGMPPR